MHRTSLPAGLLAASLLSLLGSPPGWAQDGEDAPPDAPWYLGAPLAQVTLEAAEGTLPGENLEPLLNAQQGRSFSPREVRADLAMLFQVGEFDAVEAHVEPWVEYDDEGNPRQAVALFYRALPSPSLREIRVQVGKSQSRREILTVAGLEPGQPFVEDPRRVEARVRRLLEESGYLSPTVRVEVHPVDASLALRAVDVDIVVVAGPRQRIESVQLVGMPPALARETRGVLRRQGLVEGRPYVEDALRRAREALLEMMRSEGYPQAELRGQPLVLRKGRLVRLVLVAEPGPEVEIRVRGVSRLDRKRVRALARMENLRSLTEEGLGEIAERVQEELAEDGFLDARVEVTVKEREEADGKHLELGIRVERGARHRLRRVEFQGASAWSQRFLEEATREASPEGLKRRRITPDTADAALAQVEEFYRSQGFLAVDVERQSLVPGRPGIFGVVPVDMKVRVSEGPRTMVSEIVLEGDIGPGERILDERRRALEQAPLNPAALDALAREIVAAYQNEGYLTADARVMKTLDEGAATAVVTVRVDPGARVHLRNTVIQGLRRTRRSVVQRQIELETGEPITSSALARTRSSLFDLGLFRSVDPVLVGDEDRVKDLVVKVEEMKNIAMDLGGGASTDEGLRVFLRATHRNLWGLAHRLNLLGQVGLAYEGEGWRLDTTRAEWRTAVRYEAPNIPGLAEVVFAEALLNEEIVEPSYRLSRTGAGLGLQSSVGSRGQFLMDYRVEFPRLLDVDPGALLEGDPWLPLLGLPEHAVGVADADWDVTALGVPNSPAAHRVTSGLGCLLILDRRDDPKNPRRGAHLTLQARSNDGILSEHPAALGQARLVELFPLGGLGLLVSAQGGVGSTLHLDETLPVEDRFRLGGAGSIRGYEKGGVGPKNRLEAYPYDFSPEIEPLVRYARRGDPYRWVPTGGDAMLAMNVELKFPFPTLGLGRLPNAALVGFFDAGNVYLLNPRLRTTSSVEGDPFLRAGLGAGFRYATPIGPLQLDLGINPKPRENRGEEPYRIHLSLGTL